MADFPNCPKCNSGYTYEDGSGFVCPECGHEWTLESNTESNEDNKIVKDVNGNVLNDGDTVTVIKDLKVKGSKSDVKILHFANKNQQIVIHLHSFHLVAGQPNKRHIL
ncbi:MAG TPA: zinc ribbon domain-containing protein YjdM [Desulfosporosinus sp.]|nr:zinc ribbon domain-containing protein YjdM [Desulfosporosinus sp.]